MKEFTSFKVLESVKHNILNYNIPELIAANLTRIWFVFSL